MTVKLMSWFGLVRTKEKTPLLRCFPLCEKAVKRCVNAGKNSKKYTRKLLDKLEFVYTLNKENNNFSALAYN